MKVYDFEYDGLRLSDFGMVMCKLGSGGIDTVSNGSNIEFNTISTLNGMKHELASSRYDDCLTATFQICNNFCDGEDGEISLETMRNVMRWLNRKTFHKFRLMSDEYAGIYFMASFNVSRIEMDGMLVGFELEMFSDSPFGLFDEVSLKIDNDVAGKTICFYSGSDEEGFIYPRMEINVESNGDLEVHSVKDDRTMVVRNCKAGEKITVDYPVITSSRSDHEIQNDFNWIFYRISTEFRDSENEITISLPCSVTMEYSPVAKVGV